MAGPRMRYSPVGRLPGGFPAQRPMAPRGMSPYAFGPLPFGDAPGPQVATQPQMSDDETLLRNFLETGSAEFTPRQQAPGEWTPEQWQIAAMSGDPMGVREIYDKTAQDGNEADFIKQLGTIDWTAPDSADRIVKMISENPKGFTSRAATMMDMFSKIGGEKKGDAQKFAQHGTEVMDTYSRVFSETGDKAKAEAAAADAIKASNKRDADLASQPKLDMAKVAALGSKELNLARSLTMQGLGPLDVSSKISDEQEQQQLAVQRQEEERKLRAARRPASDRFKGKAFDALKSVVSDAKNLTEFEAEFEQQAKNGYKGSREDYVKQFKGMDMNAFRQLKVAEAAQTLVDQWGLDPEEAATFAGLKTNKQSAPALAAPVYSPPSVQSVLPQVPIPGLGTVPVQPPAPAPVVQPIAPPAAPLPVVPVQASVEKTPAPVRDLDELGQVVPLTDEQKLAHKSRVSGLVNEHWSAAKGELASLVKEKKGELGKLADPEILKAALLSVQRNKLAFPKQLGLEGSKDFLGGNKAFAVADLIARALGKDPDAIADPKLDKGRGRLELRDETRAYTWRDVIKAWADDELPATGTSAVGGASDFSNLWKRK